MRALGMALQRWRVERVMHIRISGVTTTRRANQRGLRWLTYQPCVVALLGDLEQPCHRRNGPAGPVRSHESVPPLGGTAPVSLTNQAAACERMSLSIFSCRTSRRSRANSCRSAVVSPSWRTPASRSACATQLIVWVVGSNSRANSPGVLPPLRQFDHVSRKFHRVWGTMLAHFGTSFLKQDRCPFSRVNLRNVDDFTATGH